MVNTILLTILVILNVMGLYLQYKELPKEKKVEIQDKLGKNEAVLVEWNPPESGEEIAFKKALKEIGR